MAKTMDLAVRDLLGSLQLQLAALQVQVEELSEQLEAAKKANEKKADLHEVKRG